MAKAKSKIPCTELFKGEINQVSFLVWGNSFQNTKIYKFMDKKLDKKNIDKIIGVLGYIDQTFPTCSHEKKFKHLVDDLWEIKSEQIRIACIWENTSLIALYGIIKKRDAWPNQELKNAQTQRKLFLEN